MSGPETYARLDAAVDAATAQLDAQRAPRVHAPNRRKLTVENAAAYLKRHGYREEVCPRAFREVCAYIAARNNSATRKGLMLYGDVGTGKTMLLRLLGLPVRRAAWYVREWQEQPTRHDFDAVVYGAYRSGQCVVTAAEGMPRMVIDDLGGEPAGMRYGERCEVLGQVLCDRYDHWQQTGARTFVTSNCEWQAILDRYGARVTDRLREMCAVIEFRGESARG